MIHAASLRDDCSTGLFGVIIQTTQFLADFQPQSVITQTWVRGLCESAVHLRPRFHPGCHLHIRCACRTVCDWPSTPSSLRRRARLGFPIFRDIGSDQAQFCNSVRPFFWVLHVRAGARLLVFTLLGCPRALASAMQSPNNRIRIAVWQWYSAVLMGFASDPVARTECPGESRPTVLARADSLRIAQSCCAAGLAGLAGLARLRVSGFPRFTAPPNLRPPRF